MPKQTKSSISAADDASATEKPYRCHINGCNGRFNNATDQSRHKWVHLPGDLCPTCPFEGQFGQKCTEKYRGRASQMRAHWSRHHREAGPYPRVTWPPLARILGINNIDPRTFTARTSHSPSPASSLDQVADVGRTQTGGSSGRMQPPMDLSPYQYHFSAAQADNVVQQQYVQAVTPMSSFNTDSTAIPGYPEYATTPIYSALDNGFQPAVWDHPQEYHHSTSFINADSPAIPQYAPVPIYPALYHGVYPVVRGHYVPPFNLQVENQEWDLSLANPPSGYDPEY